MRFPYLRVTLEVSDGLETCQWQAVIGFVDLPLRWPILGHAGFLQFFDAQLLGARCELILEPNVSFPGTHAVHRTP